MPKLVILNCLIISIICSLIAPSFLLVTFIPAEGETVYDVSNIDQEKLGSMSSEKAKEYINEEIPFKKVTGIERFTYLFSQPGTGIHYLKVSLWMLLPFLLATLITSYLNIKYVINRKGITIWST